MATRCFIGKEEANGLLRFIYCHHGDSPDAMTDILTRFFSDEDSVNRLLNAGGISTLNTYPDRQTNENARYALSEAALRLQLAPHGFGFPIEWACIWRRSAGWTVVQNRQRDEEGDRERRIAHLFAS